MPMKKITFNAPLNHKAYSYEPMQIEVEKVVTLYGKSFGQMRDHPLEDAPEITANRDLMHMEGNTAHCILFLDGKGSGGILVEAEGADYALKSQFIPNVYSSAKITPPSLVDNPQFKSVKNMIIHAVLEMQSEPMLSEIEIPMETVDTLSPEVFKWNTDGVFETEAEPSELTIEDKIDRLTVLANQGKSFASYRLGKLYLFGVDSIERDMELAKQWLTKSAEDGNEYTQQLLDNMEQSEKTAMASTIFGLFMNLSRMIEDDYNRSHKKLQSKIDSKLQRMIHKHKQELGIKDDHGMTMQ